MDTNDNAQDTVEAVKIFTQKVLVAISYCNHRGIVLDAKSFFESITDLYNPFMDKIGGIYYDSSLSNNEKFDKILDMIFMSPAAQVEFYPFVVAVNGKASSPFSVDMGEVIYFPTTDSSLIYQDAFRIIFFLAVTDAILGLSRHLGFVETIIIKHLKRAYRSEEEIIRNSRILLEAFIKMID